MENASKALIIAGSVLLALLTISLLIYMFGNLSNYQNEQDKTQIEKQISDFNNAYTTYNRENVRGSDLYSLFNKVIDYNKRETSLGSRDIEYKPITIVLNFDNATKRRTMTKTNNNVIFMEDSYQQSGTINQFEKMIKEKVQIIESTYGSADSLTKIVTGIDKIFLDKNAKNEKKEEAYKEFNKLSKVEVKNFDELYSKKPKGKNTIYTDICIYYEFVYFKRGMFDCIACEYDQKTGRVVKMEFKFTGKFK